MRSPPLSRSALVALVVLGAAGAASAVRPFFVLNAQGGGSSGGPYAGGGISIYEDLVGLGAGVYGGAAGLSGDLLVKGSFYGLAGGGAGFGFVDRGMGPALDLWGNAVFVGLRYRLVVSDGEPFHSLGVFVPLCLLPGGSCYDFSRGYH